MGRKNLQKKKLVNSHDTKWIAKKKENQLRFTKSPYIEKAIRDIRLLNSKAPVGFSRVCACYRISSALSITRQQR